MSLQVRSAAIPSAAGRARSASRDLSLRVRVSVTRRRLDREIAGSAEIAESPARSLRAEQLTHPSTRRGIAAMLANILDAAAERRTDQYSPVIVEHEAVLEARAEILALIALLRSGAPLTPRAVALAALLAGHPDSPMVSRSSAETLPQALARIVAAG